MGSAKWLIFIVLFGTITSVILGIADMSYLGDYPRQSPMFVIFEVFGIASSGEAGTSLTFGWTSITSVAGAFISALTFNYSVLTHSEFGNFLRWVIFLPISFGLIFSLGLMLWTHVPILGRGSQ